MDIEENRLQSFEKWPKNAAIGPEPLAKAGFYATGKLWETECYKCHITVSDWQYGDEIMARHRPICPISLLDNSRIELENVSLVSGIKNVEKINLLKENEMNRLATFGNWPNPNISPEPLAKAGFYYVNHSDRVECAWCRLTTGFWESNDNAFQEHQRFSPDCPFVKLNKEKEITTDGIRDLGSSLPTTSKYSSLEARVQTYGKWPLNTYQKVLSLAQAGFFYHFIDNKIVCFHCNGHLQSCQKDNSPWFEHFRLFPDCQFIKQTMGPKYVTQVQELLRQLPQKNACETVQESMFPERPMKFHEAMCTPPVLQALQMGENSDYIRKATERHLKIFGRPYETKEELMEAVLHYQKSEKTFVGVNIDLKKEMNRLATFENWNNPNVSPQELSKAGFYYLNDSDKVKCAWCGCGVMQWAENSNAFEVHQMYVPDCPRVQLGPLIEIANESIRDLSREQISPPKKAKYSSLDARMQTYKNWAKGDIRKSGILAEAGFYYKSNQVRCFQCDKHIPLSIKDDHPWFDHARFSPDCQFINLVMGPQYVAQVQELVRQIPQNNTCETSLLTERAITLDEAMRRAPVLQALEMGLKFVYIRNATQKQLEHFGRPFETKKELVAAVLDDQEKEIRKLKDARLCQVCMDQEVGAAFLPCGHALTCVQCAPDVTQCPFCRTTITEFFRTYLP